LDIKQKEFGASAPEVVDTLMAIARWYAKRDPNKQIGFITRALLIRERESGRNSLPAAKILIQFGAAIVSLLHQTRNPMEMSELPIEMMPVLPRLEQALAVLERELGDHKDVASMLGTIGDAHAVRGNNEARREFFERALAVLERTGDFENKETTMAVHLNNLGNSSRVLKDYTRAIDVLDRALEINERELGRDNVPVAWNMWNLGLAYRGLGRFEDACAALERALPIWSKAYGDNNHLTRNLKSELARARRREGYGPAPAAAPRPAAPRPAIHPHVLDAPAVHPHADAILRRRGFAQDDEFLDLHRDRLGY